VLHSGRIWPYPQTSTRLEKLARDKHSSLLRKAIKYGQKKFYNIGPWRKSYKTFFICRLRRGQCSESVFYGFLYYARVFVKLDWKGLPRTNALAYYENL
jgi:hypothetical protein